MYRGENKAWDDEDDDNEAPSPDKLRADKVRKEAE
jgi:hypothetical protein